MTNKYFIGIDNGLNGGVAILDENSKIVELIRMPIIKTKNKREYDIAEIKNTIIKYLNKGKVI